MEISLKPTLEPTESIGTNISIPCSPSMKQDIDRLKKYYGKSVNAKIREFMNQLIKENKDKIQSCL